MVKKMALALIAPFRPNRPLFHLLLILLTSVPDTNQTGLPVLDEPATVKKQTTHFEMMGLAP